jgi:hypothetical protein
MNLALFASLLVESRCDISSPNEDLLPESWLEIGAAGSVEGMIVFGLVFDVVFQGCVYRDRPMSSPAIIFFRDLLSTLVIDECEFG